MEKRKSRYTPLPGIMHGGEKSPIKHHAYWPNSTEVIEGHSHKPRPTTAQPPKTPINMVNPASTTMMNPINQSLAPQPLMKKKKK